MAAHIVMVCYRHGLGSYRSGGIIVVVGTAEYRGSYFYGGKNGKDKSTRLNGNHDN